MTLTSFSFEAMPWISKNGAEPSRFGLPSDLLVPREAICGVGELSFA
jgi:hypothetical protein